MSDPLLVFLALLAAESVWMDFIRVDVYSLYFPAMDTEEVSVFPLVEIVTFVF